MVCFQNPVTYGYVLGLYWLIKDTFLKLCNTNPLDVANLFNSCEFPARMEDDGDKYSTASGSASDSLIPNDT